LDELKATVPGGFIKNTALLPMGLQKTAATAMPKKCGTDWY
jgi:hypothetical protein